MEIIKEHVPEDIWQGSPLLGYRQLGNTNRGEIGEEFVRRYLKKAGIPDTDGWDQLIAAQSEFGLTAPPLVA